MKKRKITAGSWAVLLALSLLVVLGTVSEAAESWKSTYIGVPAVR